MQRRNRLSGALASMLAVLLLVLAVRPGQATPADPERYRLIILHTSEHHGNALPIIRRGEPAVGGMAGRASIVGQIRAAERSGAVLVLDSGDILIGTAMSSYFRGEPDVAAMNATGYQAMAAGNHEFDFGLDHLQHLQQQARFPILCSNLTARTVELPCRASTIIETGSLRVGVLGLLGRRGFPDTFSREAARLLSLRDPVQSARETARTLRAEGADLILAITHQDTDEDLAVLNAVPEIDVIIGGHTPGFDGLVTRNARHPEPRADHPSGVFVKTHREGRTVGRLDLDVSRRADGRLTILSAQARNVPVTAEIVPDPVVAELLTSYADRLEVESGQVVGQATVLLDGEVEHVRSRETNLGDLLADLLRAEFGTDVAFINSGQIRDSIPAGPVDLRRVLRVLPFQSSTVTFTVTGRRLREAMENSASLLPGTPGRFLQISGMMVSYDLAAPAGSRVRELRIGGRPVEAHRRYTVATDAFVADGGDGYSMLTEAEERIERQVPIRDLLLHALAKGPLTGSVDGRIRFTPPPSPPAP